MTTDAPCPTHGTAGICRQMGGWCVVDAPPPRVCDGCGEPITDHGFHADGRTRCAPLVACARCGQPLADDNCPDQCECYPPLQETYPGSGIYE